MREAAQASDGLIVLAGHTKGSLVGDFTDGSSRAAAVLLDTTSVSSSKTGAGHYTDGSSSAAAVLLNTTSASSSETQDDGGRGTWDALVDWLKSEVGIIVEVSLVVAALGAVVICRCMRGTPAGDERTPQPEDAKVGVQVIDGPTSRPSLRSTQPASDGVNTQPGWSHGCLDDPYGIDNPGRGTPELVLEDPEAIALPEEAKVAPAYRPQAAAPPSPHDQEAPPTGPHDEEIAEPADEDKTSPFNDLEEKGPPLGSSEITPRTHGRRNGSQDSI